MYPSRRPTSCCTRSVPLRPRRTEGSVIFSSAYSSECSWLQLHHQRDAAVQSLGSFLRIGVLGIVFAVAHGAQAVRGDTASNEIVPNTIRATLCQREVVHRRADVAGMPF